ncbi:MAG: SDR family oxidoreductase [Chloroflexi bacterium]|nr:SDR family oxidoreductase [Chloroflexota bacterium]
MELGLAGKIAVVTGGSEGIGRATAAALAREGARVAICARRPEPLEAAAAEIRRATGAEVLAIPADVADPEACRDLIDQVVNGWGGVDILVNNAGRSAASRFERVDDADWEADIDLKLMGWVHLIRRAIPSMRERGGGRIINVTMVGGKAPGANSLPTSVSRAAGIALTKALSKDYAAENILVNTVCVGTIKSAQIERAARRRFPDLPLDDAWREMGKGIPVGRVGEAEEVGDLIAFLASARAAFITGAAINVDGGVAPVV